MSRSIGLAIVGYGYIMVHPVRVGGIPTSIEDNLLRIEVFGARHYP